MASLTKDPNWDNTDAALWSFIELCIGVLTSSLPTLRPLIAAALPRVFGSSAGRRGYHDYSSNNYYASGLGSMAAARRKSAAAHHHHHHNNPKKSSLSSESLDELNQQHHSNSKDDIELALGGGNNHHNFDNPGRAAAAAPAYSVNVFCGDDREDADGNPSELRRPAAAAKRSGSQRANGIMTTTVVSREYEPSVQHGI